MAKTGKDSKLGEIRYAVREMLSLPNPPELVKDLWIPTRMLLGYSETKDFVWGQKEMKSDGKSLLEQFSSCDPSKLSPATMDRVTELLRAIEPEKLMNVSRAAHEVYKWEMAMATAYDKGST